MSAKVPQDSSYVHTTAEVRSVDDYDETRPTGSGQNVTAHAAGLVDGKEYKYERVEKAHVDKSGVVEVTSVSEDRGHEDPGMNYQDKRPPGVAPGAPIGVIASSVSSTGNAPDILPGFPGPLIHGERDDVHITNEERRVPEGSVKETKIEEQEKGSLGKADHVKETKVTEKDGISGISRDGKRIIEHEDLLTGEHTVETEKPKGFGGKLKGTVNKVADKIKETITGKDSDDDDVIHDEDIRAGMKETKVMEEERGSAVGRADHTETKVTEKDTVSGKGSHAGSKIMDDEAFVYDKPGSVKETKVVEKKKGSVGKPDHVSETKVTEKDRISGRSSRDAHVMDEEHLVSGRSGDVKETKVVEKNVATGNCSTCNKDTLDGRDLRDAKDDEHNTSRRSAHSTQREVVEKQRSSGRPDQVTETKVTEKGMDSGIGLKANDSLEIMKDAQIKSGIPGGAKEMKGVDEDATRGRGLHEAHADDEHVAEVVEKERAPGRSDRVTETKVTEKDTDSGIGFNAKNSRNIMDDAEFISGRPGSVKDAKVTEKERVSDKRGHKTETDVVEEIIH